MAFSVEHVTVRIPVDIAFSLKDGDLFERQIAECQVVYRVKVALLYEHPAPEEEDELERLAHAEGAAQIRDGQR